MKKRYGVIERHPWWRVVDRLRNGEVIFPYINYRGEALHVARILNRAYADGVRDGRKAKEK